ncbi:hypothetical protein EV202_1173 [Bacteroides heparinolyticus]|uniref:Uncharacterized protein n=1 Tax=Prevotella heparinolytica TaxID=28113 RepID=A0A4R2LI75_9BACE|nr:hypothetical protein EV202_1173 [Bacteroides heparinolyticus]
MQTKINVSLTRAICNSESECELSETEAARDFLNSGGRIGRFTLHTQCDFAPDVPAGGEADSGGRAMT